jgi:hypothetical protein
LESGKDVYVEKPMTHTVEEGKAVAHRASRLLKNGPRGLHSVPLLYFHSRRRPSALPLDCLKGFFPPCRHTSALPYAD